VKNHNVDEEMRTENRFYIICPTHVKIKIKKNLTHFALNEIKTGLDEIRKGYLS
jgi:hypothetical protein